MRRTTRLPPTCTDADGDGYYAEPGCGTSVDCDDANPNINAGAVEICDDGVDNDCDGMIDCDDLDCIRNKACKELYMLKNENYKKAVTEFKTGSRLTASRGSSWCFPFINTRRCLQCTPAGRMNAGTL